MCLVVSLKPGDVLLHDELLVKVQQLHDGVRSLLVLASPPELLANHGEQQIVVELVRGGKPPWRDALEGVAASPHVEY